VTRGYRLDIKKLNELIYKAGGITKLAYFLIDEELVDHTDEKDEVKRLVNAISKHKERGRVPKKWKETYKKALLKLEGINVEKKLFESMFLNFLKDVKIAFYEDKELSKEYAVLFMLYMIILDDEFIEKSIDEALGKLFEKTEGIKGCF